MHCSGACTDLCEARALLRQLLNVVAGGGVIGEAQHPREAVDGVAWQKVSQEETWQQPGGIAGRAPTAMSIVSPNILYLPSAYAITCVLPPLTYNTTGSTAPVTQRPISMCATQWLTPTTCATVGSEHAQGQACRQLGAPACARAETAS